MLCVSQLGPVGYYCLMGLFGRETERDRATAEAWSQWAKRQNVYALVSLVLGIFSLIEFGALVIFGVGGIATGVIALRQLSREGAVPPRGHRIAWAGIVLSVVSLVIAAVIYLMPRHPH